ncbi:MAG TPA: 2-dehydropantoate 2-reductase [Azospirillaceae bacterium]|nr:2-dehydropantoate 2-reductase [Azospirillaceae bacterium]
MRILVLGAGATGGYFGGRLMEAGENVTFLVRPRRQAQLREEGLAVASPLGNIRLPAQTVTAARKPYDLVLLSCKAYDLDGAIEAVRPAVGPDSVVLPVLNGLAHLERLDAAFGRERVLGGLCHISTALEPDGTIRHLNRVHRLAWGARDPAAEPAAARFAEAVGRTTVDGRHSPDILQEMWEKWVMLATLAASTCLMRASVGAILRAGGEGFLAALLEECRRVAEACGHPPGEAAAEACRRVFGDPASPMAASMLRDLQRGGPTEAEHVLGDLLRRGRAHGLDLPHLALACVHLKAAEEMHGAS